MTPVISRRAHLRARKIWIDDALGGAARRRLSALWQRGIAAFDVAALYVVDLQADRVVRIIRLGASRRCRQNRHARQNRQSRNAHQSLLTPPGRKYQHSSGASRRGIAKPRMD